MNGKTSYTHGLEDLIFWGSIVIQTDLWIQLNLYKKIPAGFFADIDKLILKFIWKFNRSRIYKIVVKKNKAGGLKCPDFKTYK